MYLAGKSIREIRHACLEGSRGTYPEQVFWVGKGGKTEMEVIVRFDNIAKWILQDCHGDKNKVRESVHEILGLMEWQIYEMLGVITPEEDAQLPRLPLTRTPVGQSSSYTEFTNEHQNQSNKSKSFIETLKDVAQDACHTLPKER